MENITRLTGFQDLLGEAADLAFLPVSTDLQYLTGVPRDIPNYGTVLHPGGWLEGAWLTPSKLWKDSLLQGVRRGLELN